MEQNFLFSHVLLANYKRATGHGDDKTFTGTVCSGGMVRALTAALLTVVALSGCLGGVPADSTDSPTATATPFPSGSTTLPDGPKTAPERPDTLTESAVREYVRTYEYRYAYNALWYSEHSDVNLECSVDAVHERASGYAATVSCTGYSNTGGDTEGTQTATELHADWFTQTYTYLVDGDTTRRLDPDAVESPTGAPTGDD